MQTRFFIETADINWLSCFSVSLLQACIKGSERRSTDTACSPRDCISTEGLLAALSGDHIIEARPAPRMNMPMQPSCSTVDECNHKHTQKTVI